MGGRLEKEKVREGGCWEDAFWLQIIRNGSYANNINNTSGTISFACHRARGSRDHIDEMSILQAKVE